MDSEKKLKKPNHEIGFTLANGAMNFLSRKVYNTLIYHAQKMGKENKGVLPFGTDWNTSKLQGFDIKNFFWISMRELIEDSASSHDRKRVTEVLEEMQRVLVRRGKPGEWLYSAQIIGEVLFLDTETKSSAPPKWAIGWNYPASLEDFCLDPAKYTSISLRYQALLSTEASMALYEIARRYAGWEQHRTNSMSWEEWQATIASSHAQRKTYKLFKRDILNPALNEINKNTDVEIVLHEDKDGGRAIKNLVFFVDVKKQKDLELPPGPALDFRILDELESAGVAPKVAKKLIETLGGERCASNLALYLKEDGKGVGWLVSAIKSNYAAAIAEPKKQNPSAVEQEAKKVADKKRELDAEEEAKRQISEEQNAGLSAYQKISPNNQSEAVKEYLGTLKNKLLLKSAETVLANNDWTRDLESRDARLFCLWYARNKMDLATIQP